MFLFRPATLKDVYSMTPRLRPEDATELETALGMSAGRALFDAYKKSRLCFVGGPDDETPVVIFGVGPDPRNPHLGIVWMVGTVAMMKYATSIFRFAPDWLKAFTHIYTDGLHALSDSRNAIHLRWLRIMGFKKLGVQELNGVPFHYVHYR